VTEGWDEEFDVVVLGAGAAGMTAALVASIEGLRTLLVEHTAFAGGTTARSSGTVWIPDNPLQRRAGIADDAQRACAYLDALVGQRAQRSLREAFVREGPRMLEYLERHTDVRFRMYREHPDYRQELPGAAAGGRPLEPEPFDGRTLGAAFERLGWPLPELMLFGGMMVTRGEAARLLRIGRPWDSLALGTGLVARYLADRLGHRRGTRLVLGNALAGRLLRNLLARGVPVRYETTTLRLEGEAGRVQGLLVERDGARSRIRARRAVVLAGGGFPASAALRARHLPTPTPEHTPAYDGCVGDTMALAQRIGAALGPDGEDNALWFPSSVAVRDDGSTAVYPHIVLDRAKPGLVAVNAAGRRFVDEAVSYHEFTRAMYRSHRSVTNIPAWLVCDRRFLWKYGLGMIRPHTLRLGRWLRRGYLKRSRTIDGLADAIGVDAIGLAETVRRNNAHAAAGVDADFGKGGNRYDLANGDPAHRPNPCLGPIETPPFFAVAVVPTPLGTSLGLRTDANARVCDARGEPIDGLYACGNDMHSVMGGEYPGAGAQIGSAMTFGYVAARHAAGRADG